MGIDYVVFSVVAVIVAAVIILAYWAMRSIDHVFRNKEALFEYRNEAMLQNDAYIMERANKRSEIDYQYNANKKLVRSFCDQQKRMSEDMIKKINDGIWDSANKIGEL